MSEEKIFIQPTELLHDSFRLGVKILESGYVPDYIVAIWRGGTPIGIAVQELLDYAGVETDHNLSQARVFVVAEIPDDELVDLLEEHRVRLQRAISEQSRLRRVPPLVFVADETVRSADRIEAILRELNLE